MKKIILYSIALVGIFASCTVLENQPETKFTQESFFNENTTEEMLTLFTNTFYNEFKGYGNAGAYGDFYFNTLNDNQAVTGLSPWTYTSVGATNSVWDNAYTEIRRANTLIEGLAAINEDIVSADAKLNWEGVGRLYRAWQHYKLVRAFGDVIWVDHVVADTENEILYAPRQDRDKVMDLVLADLDFAVQNITANKTSKVAFNVYVANAMKAEICLYEGTFCKYRSTTDGQKEPDAARAEKYLKACIDACNEVYKGGYELNASYKANYDSEDLAGNKEMILYKHYVYGALAHSTIDYTCGSTQVNGMNLAAFKSYLAADGTLANNTDLTGELVDYAEWGKTKLKYDKAGNIDMDNGTIRDSIVLTAKRLSIAKLLQQRDPRLSAQVDSLLQFVGNGVVRYSAVDKANTASTAAAQSTSSTGFGVCKFDNSRYSQTHRQSINQNSTDAPVFWLANVLLNEAEAQAELGNQTEAEKAINQLRARAGMPNMTLLADPANNMGVSDLIWEVRRERRVELMYDNNDRYWSLIRWHQLDKLDTDLYPEQAMGANITGFVKEDSKANEAAKDANGFIVTLNGNKRTYNARYYLYPIPSNELSLNPNLGQNYGW